MSRRLPPLNALRAFEAAGRHESFTKAAEELNVTHGAVSRQVAQLEEWLGASLFRRVYSQLALTDAGRVYLPEVTAALDRLSIVSSQLAEQKPQRLHVDAPPTFTMRWMIARMSSFHRKHPGVEVRMTASIAPINFQEHRYDIAIRGAHAPIPGVVSHPFMTELIIAVGHADLFEGNGSPVPADLSGHTLISYATEPYSWADWLEVVGQGGLKPAATLRFEQMYFALQAAAEGLGIVLVPLFLAIDDIIAGRLCAPFGPLGAKQRRYYAIAAQSSPVIEAFFEWLLLEGRATADLMAEWAASAGWRDDALPRS